MKLSIIILTKDKVEYLKKTINTLEQFNDLNDNEVIIISNNSIEEDTFLYFEKLKLRKNYQIIENNSPFNYSELNNFGVKFATGQYLLFLNNDMEFLIQDTLDKLLTILNEPGIGIVGATLLYPNRTIQHSGVNIHSLGAWQPYRYGRLEELPHLTKDRQVSAVIGACLLIRKKHFELVGGFCEDLQIVLNDIDLCLKIEQLGLKIMCSKEILIHHEGISRGKKSPPQDRNKFSEVWINRLFKGEQFDNSLEISLTHIKNFFEKYQISSDRPIYFFGASGKGMTNLNVFKEFNIKGFIDNDEKKWGITIGPYKVFGPSVLSSIQNKPYIIITSQYYNEIEDQISKEMYKYKKDYYRIY